MKPILILVVVGVLAIVGFFVISSRPDFRTKRSELIPQTKEETEIKTVETKASFAIFTNGTFRIFTASMYHNLSEDVYIQADNPNVVHVKKSNTTWDDFF